MDEFEFIARPLRGRNTAGTINTTAITTTPESGELNESIKPLPFGSSAGKLESLRSVGTGAPSFGRCLSSYVSSQRNQLPPKRITPRRSGPAIVLTLGEVQVYDQKSPLSNKVPPDLAPLNYELRKHPKSDIVNIITASDILNSFRRSPLSTVNYSTQSLLVRAHTTPPNLCWFVLISHELDAQRRRFISQLVMTRCASSTHRLRTGGHISAI